MRKQAKKDGASLFLSVIAKIANGTTMKEDIGTDASALNGTKDTKRKARRTMANRNTLSVNQVEKFKAYLVDEGWELQETKGDYEVLRATKEGRNHTLIAYSRLATNGGKEIQHLTLADRDMPIVRAFLKKK